MRITTRRKAEVSALFAQEYASVLREYASGGGETALGLAYELGRRAIAEQKSLVEIGLVHHQVLQGLLDDENDGQRRENLLRAGGEFLGECLSPYEMAQRGFRDAVKALRQLNETLEEEIKRIAYAIHDEAGQLLVAVHLALAEMARELPKHRQKQVNHIEGLLNDVEKQLRRFSHELRPTILDDLGWIPAIRALADGASKRAAVPIHVETMVSGRLPGAIETALYRIVQEAINNVIKHAKAQSVWIRAWQVKKTLFCSVRDDGAGFDVRNVQRTSDRKGLGLVAMQERATAIGGTVRIEATPGRGTELTLQLPLEGNHANSRRARG